MNKTIENIDLGLIDYKSAWDYQENLFKNILDIKTNNFKTKSEDKTETPNHLILCEHNHVYTLGKSGSENNLLIDYIQLNAKHATFYKTNRGGDITYHGPGQIVGYPILDLENFDLSIHNYIYNIEEVIIRTINEFGIKAERLNGATGVWLDTDKAGLTRKICAIGVRCSRYVTMHGFALNVNTDLDYFNHINPCGFVDKGVTSIKKELGEEIDFEKVKVILLKKFAEVFI